MCGIAGLVGTFERDEAGAAHARVARMVCALNRRGPDDEGIEAWGARAVLGHRRLSIFDLSEAGRQPMLSDDRRVGVVFNGAIYNFRALRAELEARGCRFRTQTDTEVLLHGYREWGFDELVARLRGMFAIGLWDDEARKLFLVRDRLGVKPLVYAARDGQLAFASTVRALRHGGFAGEIDEQAVAEYLEFGYVTDARAIYEGVAKVPAATIVEWSDGRLQSRVYWTPPEVAARSSAPAFEEAVEQTEALFLRAVEQRLYADVPVGALLSGGVDSSLVCWAIARLGGDVTAYTIGTPGDAWDESADARATAGALGIRHRVLELSADGAPGVGELSAAYAEPFACASALGMLRVSRAVAPEATVLLTGDGGDDVFLGYPEHRHLWLAGKLAGSLPGAAARTWLARRESFPRVGALKRAASFLDYATGGLGAVACAHDGLPVYRRHGLLGERLMSATIEQRQIVWSHESARNVLAEFLRYDRRMRFVGEYLPKVDGATMHYALEARSPFLDQELWESAAALPYEVRLRRGQLKAVLREIARRRLGERVASGRKRGFGVPVGRWLAGRWRGAVEEMLADSLVERGGWIRAAPARALLARTAAEGAVPNQLWYVYVLESWLRHERADAQAHAAEHDERELVAPLTAPAA
ncbi:MAG TPA: asparagine synthase (glutamine-hydrolyzing) [Pyrinomonadaceae bacterium]|nr:asparagine synthase (glutamine-hydrolyzing) [Pyrinomonadaceae bacterium]